LGPSHSRLRGRRRSCNGNRNDHEYYISDDEKDLDEEDFILLGNDNNVTYKPRRFRRIRWRRKKFTLLLLLIGIMGMFCIYKIFKKEKLDLIFIQGSSRKDKYGVELNKGILDGIYCIGFDNNVTKTLEEWDLYTPSCPNLKPIHYPDSIINPKCEDNSIQLINYDSTLPYSHHLDSITNQMKKWKDWEKKGGYIRYGSKKVHDLVGDRYFPFDYGYTGEDTSNIDDTEYYKKVVNSRMDEVPDPRRRRLFSFILFNSEYELLDVYLSQYYEIFDYFVIYESNTTFTGMPKPLYFTRALLETNRYDKFKDKLIPLPMKIIVNENNPKGHTFAREHVARRLLIAEGLKLVHARHGDIFLHGDLDEFVKPHVITRLKKCGGWEHLQAGIGGGPKSFKEKSTDSYFLNPNITVVNDKYGFYMVDYENRLSVGMQSWFHEYSFNIVQNSTIGTTFHPNIAIFDARRSLGQLVNRYNWKFSPRSEYSDPLMDPNFNPYQGYEYTDNTNDDYKGKGFLGEFLRYESKFLDFEKKLTYDVEMREKGKSIFWSAAWHLSSFFPTIEHIYNKVYSYSHMRDYYLIYKSENQIKKDIIQRIKNHQYIFGSKKKYDVNEMVLPENYSKGYEYNFNAKYWDDNLKNSDSNPEFTNYINNLKREIPSQVWKNPICYSYMIDREYGFEKKIWWQVIPKEQWETVRFEELDEETLNQITPSILSETFKKEMFEEMKKSRTNNESTEN